MSNVTQKGVEDEGIDYKQELSFRKHAKKLVKSSKKYSSSLTTAQEILALFASEVVEFSAQPSLDPMVAPYVRSFGVSLRNASKQLGSLAQHLVESFENPMEDFLLYDYAELDHLKSRLEMSGQKVSSKQLASVRDDSNQGREEEYQRDIRLYQEKLLELHGKKASKCVAALGAYVEWHGTFCKEGALLFDNAEKQFNKIKEYTSLSEEAVSYVRFEPNPL